MAFLSKFSRALGFGRDDDDDGIIADDPDSTNPYTPASTPYTESPKAADEPARKDDSAMQQRIFTHVVETFNAALPDFLARSVDPATQRKLLYDGLQADLRKYIDDIAGDARRRCSEEWTRERHKLQEKVNELETQAREIESKRNEMVQKQLSSERQRRALSERVHDLEKQVAQLEAEREQFQLESRSLQNKLKVANVQEKEYEDLQEENLRMRQELNNARKGLPVAAAAPDPEIMKQLSETKQKLEEANSAVREKDGLITTKDSEIERLNKEVKALKQNVSEAIDPELIHELEEKLNRFEDVRRKKDARISELQKNERELNKQIAGLNAELKELKEQQSRDEDTSAPADKPAPRPEARPIDDILSDTDWLVSPSSLKGNKSGRSTRQHTKNNHDDQMSLF